MTNDDTHETIDQSANQESADDESSDSNAEQKEKQANPWWQKPTIVTLLVAIIAAAAPISTAVQSWIQASSELELERYKHQTQIELEREKQLHEMRQKYLERVSSNQNIRVLEFLVAVEEDQKLKGWAEAELKIARGDLNTKQALYAETIRVVAQLANRSDSIDEAAADYKSFWELYDEKLLPVESAEVENLMVTIGNELKRLAAAQEKPSSGLKNLSFQLARTMKEELQ